MTSPRQAQDAPSKEETLEFAPKFDRDGLIVAFVTDAHSQKPLMVAYMNADALQRTLDTGEAHFWSRSRREIWHKGATSGNVLTIKEIRVDCDQDALWLSVTIAGHGAACHTGRESCFYRVVVSGNSESAPRLEMIDDQPKFRPDEIYKR